MILQTSLLYMLIWCSWKMSYQCAAYHFCGLAPSTMTSCFRYDFIQYLGVTSTELLAIKIKRAETYCHQILFQTFAVTAVTTGLFLKEYKKWNVPYIYFTAVENGVASVLVVINSLHDMILKMLYTSNLFIRNRLLFVMKTLAAYGNHCNQSLLLFHPSEWCHKPEHIQYIISTLDEY